ncbi:MAG: NAD(P)-binding protein, partial [Lachnospiraceae bacterium]|nr:NAD(P)-binding protein [Lachnospiraceae bacterium]
MIRVQQIKVPLKHNKNDLLKKAAKICRITPEQIQDMEIVKQSIDARRKDEVCYVYTVDIKTPIEEKILKRVHDKNITLTKRITYQFQMTGKNPLCHRPVIVGAGPAGLFCAYELAKAGYDPLLLERGKTVEERKKDVVSFWETGNLDFASNVQFGEGGAGTFSDGKLNTLIKDKRGIGRHVLETFVEYGANPEILYMNKPHIGTDRLCEVIGDLRKAIVEMGGEIRFLQEVTDLEIEKNSLKRIEINKSTWIETDVVVFAIGHSARDTFSMFYKRGIPMDAKSFAVGLRIEHPQEMINRVQYKGADMRYLPSASYKLTSNLENGRGVYSFCMCP